MFEFLKDLIFPKTCLGCGEWGNYLCSNCVNFISVCQRLICPQCARPSFAGFTHFSCQRTYGLIGLTAIFSYKGIVKKAITKLKYQFVTDLAATIEELFLSFCGENKAFTKFVSQKKVILVPVPLYWQRKNWRGFNQAELLGKMISCKLGIKFTPDLLIRIKNTKTQTKLKKEERLKNMKNAFLFNNRKYSNIFKSFDPSILLFDDVWTTGATLKECAKVLKRKYKTSQIWGLTLARQE